MDKLQKVNVIGKQGYHKFRNTKGEIFCVPCSSEDYKNVFVNTPKLDGCEWISSSETALFDTADGWLANGQYAELPGENQQVFALSDLEFTTPSGSVVDGIIQPEASERLAKKDGYFAAIKNGEQVIVNEIWL